MTQEELTRSKVIQMADEKRMTQKEGAERIGVSQRHFRRLLARYRQDGDLGLISGHRGKPSNNRMAPETQQQVTDFICDPLYKGFGPTLMAEKLAERAGIVVSKETVRQVMIAEGKHEPRRKKSSEIHPLRERRARRGELVQIDGSYHAWLEDRGAKACLLLFVDDATSQALAGRFVPQETYFAYAELCKAYFAQHGLPVTFYSDRFSVFRVNAENAIDTDAITQFGRALAELGIELICANSPQAKGRIERAYQTFQDRLIKEMRLEGICDYEHANQFLPTFLRMYAEKFSVLPRSSQDAHLPLDPAIDLDRIFASHHTRIISKNLQIQFNRVIYQIKTTRPAYALQGRKVTAVLYPNDQVAFYLNHQNLTVEEFRPQPKQAEIKSAKAIEQTHYSPPPDHPWRNYGKKLNPNPTLSSKT
jgi:transposase